MVDPLKPLYYDQVYLQMWLENRFITDLCKDSLAEFRLDVNLKLKAITLKSVGCFVKNITVKMFSHVS